MSTFEVHTEIPDDNGPLANTVLPESLEDVAMQIEVLPHFYDVGVAHAEADRMLLVALRIIQADSNDAEQRSAIDDIIHCYNKTRKDYI